MSQKRLVHDDVPIPAADDPVVNATHADGDVEPPFRGSQFIHQVHHKPIGLVLASPFADEPIVDLVTLPGAENADQIGLIENEKIGPAEPGSDLFRRRFGAPLLIWG